MYPDNPPLTIPSIVCYADILGYSELSRTSLERGEGDAFLQNLHAALVNAYKRVRKHSDGWSEKEFIVKIFTDNIVVGYPLTRFASTLGEPELGKIFTVFAEFQLGLIMEGFLVRGGIAFGKHFMDDDIVFGDALLEAIAQDKNGGAPRISLAPSAVEALRYHLGFYGDGKHAPQRHDVLEDAEGTIFIHYLNQAFLGFPEAGIFFDVFEKHKATIVQGLERNKGMPSIRAKYEWAARYHNYVCRDFKDRHPVPTGPDADPEYAHAALEAQNLSDYLIDIESYAAFPSKIQLTPLHRRHRA